MIPHAPDPWRAVSAARLPVGGLSALAAVRNREGVRVLLADGVAWVRWPAGQSEVVRCLLPVPEIAFFTHSNGLWFRFGHSVPTNDTPPSGEGASVAAVLAPERFEPLPPNPQTWSPVALTVVHGGELKPTTALTCTISELAKWADSATTAELAAVRAARSGECAVLLGKQLPAIPTATRYWGKEVLVPLGFRAEPDLPEATLREAVGVSKDELLLLNKTGAVVIPLSVFESLTRASVRLGAQTA
jgi:hypothetical protein